MLNSTSGNFTGALLFIFLLLCDLTMTLLPEMAGPNESHFLRIGHVEPRCCPHLSLSTIPIWEICFLALAITMGDFSHQQKDKSHYQVSICLMFSSEALESDQLLLDLNSSFFYPSSLLIKSQAYFKTNISYDMFFICNMKRAE